MIYHFPVKRLRTAFCLAMIVTVTACGGGGGGDDGATLTTPLNNGNNLSNGDETHTIIGSVGDGPIKNAIITVKDANGGVVVTAMGNAQANYTLSVPTDSLFPLEITATGGIDIVSNAPPEFALVAVVMDSGDQTANLNPFSTFIVKIAQARPGGLTAANIAIAKDYVLSQLNFGFDETLIADPVSTPIDTNNVANIVKSSEALAEMIRRAHAEMMIAGSTLTQDQIIDALARDLSDGKIDGLGAGTVDPRLAAMANIAAGQVLVESLRNELRVGNVNVRAAMDNAIKTILPQATMTTADVVITERMLNQVKLVIEMAQEIAPNADLTTLSQQLANITSDSRAAQVKDVLSAEGRDTVNVVLKMIGTATVNELEAMNRRIRNENSAPTLNGSPIRIAKVDVAYSFSPTANDADGDALTFSITNKPDWANFNVNTGALTGTPTNEGEAQNIVIMVSDDKLTASLSAFSITVTAVAVDATPLAKNDSGYSTDGSAAITIPVLDNDSGLDDGPIQVSIIQSASKGTAVVLSNNTIQYTANGNDSGSDSFVYRITDADGDIAMATVMLQVTCGACATDVTLNLAWDANPEDENILGYNVYYGSSENTTSSLYKRFSANDVNFDLSLPSIDLNAGVDLELRTNDTICFTVSAYNSGGESNKSTATCSTI